MGEIVEGIAKSTKCIVTYRKGDLTQSFVRFQDQLQRFDHAEGFEILEKGDMKTGLE